VDNHGEMVTYSSGSWGSPFAIDGTKELDSVSCPTTTDTQCVAVDDVGDVVTYNGTTWISTDIDSTRPLNSVSCPTTSFCDAVDNDGEVFTSVGGWSSSNDEDIDFTHALESISCASSVSCVAVDNDGNAAVYVGTGSSPIWNWEPGIDGTRVMAAVSCASANFCMAVDGSGHALSYNGLFWQAVTSVDTADTAEAISCPSESFCDLVDGSGKTLTYTTSDLTWDRNGSPASLLSDGTNDYIDGPMGNPVEEVDTTASTPTSVATFMMFTPGDSSWLLTNSSGAEVGFDEYDAFGTLSFSSGMSSAFGFAGQYQGTSANASGLQNMQARWYDDQTGQFTTRDSAFDQTDQAYRYAGDDPVNDTDPTGKMTVGICGSAAAGAAALLGGGVSGQVCLVRTVFDPHGEDDIGITETVGISNVGLGASAGIGVSYQVTNAVHLQDLAHWFYAVDISADIGPGLSGSFFWGKGTHGQSIYGINGGLSFGGGFSALVFSTNTWVQQAHGGGFLDLGSGVANTLRGIWDGLVPPKLTIASNLYTEIAKARTAANAQGSNSSSGSGGPSSCS
jgi:RHS repeat-associated protein